MYLWAGAIYFRQLGWIIKNCPLAPRYRHPAGWSHRWVTTAAGTGEARNDADDGPAQSGAVAAGIAQPRPPRSRLRGGGPPQGGARGQPGTGAGERPGLGIAAVAAACAGASACSSGSRPAATETNEPRTEKARSALLEDIDRAEQRQSELATSAADLAEQLRATQSGLGAAGPLQTVAALENAGQITPVTGPGCGSSSTRRRPTQPTRPPAA